MPVGYRPCIASLTDDALLDVLISVGVPGFALLAALALWRVRRGFFPLLAVVVALAGLYVVAVVLIATDYHDADGFVDCWPYCSALQEIVGSLFLYGGGLLLVLGLFSLSARVVLALRAGRRGAQGS